MRRLIKYYFRALLQGPASGAFSWAAIPGNAVAAGLLNHFGLFSNTKPSDIDSIKFAFYGAAAAFFISLVILAFFVAPRRAWLMLRPTRLSISKLVGDPEIRANSYIIGHTINLVVENRSSEHLLDCYVQVKSIEGILLGTIERQMVPRFVEKFDMPPKTTKRIALAYWFQRNDSNKDDSSIGICGPVAACFGGNILRVPLSKSKIKAAVESTDKRSKAIEFFMWVDAQSRDLKAQLCQSPGPSP